MLNKREKIELKILLETMDVPNDKAEDKFWLMRNLGIGNKEHINFKRAIELIKRM
jgi:hypothetical protein